MNQEIIGKRVRIKDDPKQMRRTSLAYAHQEGTVKEQLRTGAYLVLLDTGIRKGFYINEWESLD